MPYKNDTGYPSSTEILSPWIDKEWFKPEHAKRGERVHGACSANLLGQYVMKPDDYPTYYESFLMLRPHILEVFVVEIRYVDESLGFCGQPDLVARMDGAYNNWIMLWDWKTSQARYKYWGPQTASYKYLVETNTGLPIDRCATARLRSPNNNPHLPPLINIFDPEQTEFHWQVFCNALINHNFFGGKYGY